MCWQLISIIKNVQCKQTNSKWQKDFCHLDKTCAWLCFACKTETMSWHIMHISGVFSVKTIKVRIK